MTIYIDLNIFDRLEKLDKISEVEKPNYQTLFTLLTDKKVTTAYSNAHLNDLFRGFQKSPDYINGHLSNIKKFTGNLCICQYWGEKEVKWHYRDIFDFFQEKIEEWKFEPNSYDELFKDEPLMQSALDLHKLIPLPPDLRKAMLNQCLVLCFHFQKFIIINTHCKQTFTIFS